MSRQVRKYDLDSVITMGSDVGRCRRVAGVPVVELTVPGGAKPLTVQVQGAHAMLWVEVDDVDEPVVTVVPLAIIGTGQAIPDFATEWIATWQEPPPLVWHLYAVDDVLLKAAEGVA